MTAAIILAAGRGSRMRELTAEQPKCFARLHGRRLLDWQLDAIRGAGIASVAIVRGYQREAFDVPVEYFENQAWANSNMVRTLLQAGGWLQRESCIVSYSDIVYTPATVQALMSTEGDLAIAYDPAWLQLWSQRFADPLADAESFRLEDGRLQTIGERCSSVEEIQGQYMGLLKFTPVGWEKVAELLRSHSDAEIDRLDMTSLLRKGLAAGWRISVCPVIGPWGEVDEPGDLALYHQIIPAAELAGGAVR